MGRSAPEHGPSALRHSNARCRPLPFLPHPLRLTTSTRFTFVPPRDQVTTTICFSRSHFIVLHLIITLLTKTAPPMGPRISICSNSEFPVCLCEFPNSSLVVFATRRSRSLSYATRSSRATLLTKCYGDAQDSTVIGITQSPHRNGGSRRKTNNL